MITISNIFIKYGDRILMDHINLVIGDKDKIGLVGRNGAGKSTLLKIIAQEMLPDSGKAVKSTGCTIGYLHQDMNLPKGKTVIEETLTAFANVRKIQREINEINDQISNRSDFDSPQYLKMLDHFSELNDELIMMGGDAVQAQSEKVLNGLGFKNSDMNRLTDEFSGGWQMRIELAKMLLQKPDYLLLDEPTNHLDIESIIWLEQFLQDYPGAAIIISHDIQFLDNVTNRTVEIEFGKLFDYKASYSRFVELQKERKEKTLAAYQNQQRVIAQKERTITRFMAKATKTKMAQSMKKQLDKMERIEIPDEDNAAMSIRFMPVPRSGDIVIKAQNLSKSYGNLSVLEKVEMQLDRGERVAFVGQNGQGKTTLARILINDLSTTDGEIKLGHNVSIGYYAQNQSDTLDPMLNVLQTMEQIAPRELYPQLRGILGAFMFSGEDVEKKVRVLSGGEKARLAMACMLLRPFNLLVLDEPTNHLDINSKSVLKNALMQYTGSLLVVSHDREFLSGLTDKTIEFRNRKLYNYLGDVNAFLEKRALDNMREVEMRDTVTVEKPKVESKKELSYEERKRLMRNVSNAERKIEKLEEGIQRMEEQMSAPGFFEKPESEEVMKAYQQHKEDLDLAMEEWETTQAEADEFL